MYIPLEGTPTVSTTQIAENQCSDKGRGGFPTPLEEEASGKTSSNCLSLCQGKHFQSMDDKGLDSIATVTVSNASHFPSKKLENRLTLSKGLNNPQHTITQPSLQSSCCKRVGNTSKTKPRRVSRVKLNNKKLHARAVEYLLDNSLIKDMQYSTDASQSSNDLVSLVLDSYYKSRSSHIKIDDILTPILEENQGSINGIEVIALSKLVADVSLADTYPEVKWAVTPKNIKINIPHELSIDQSILVNDIVKAYPTVILDADTIPMGEAKLPFMFDIKLVEGGFEKLCRNVKPFPLRGTMLNTMKTAMEDMERAGVGSKDTLWTSVASPAFFVKRARDSKLRLCVDYKELNKYTIPFNFPIPEVQMIMDQLGGKKFFTILDLKSGYWQIKMTKRARKLSTMTTPVGNFTYNVIPFGMTNAPPFFQMAMQHVLKDGLFKYCMVYIDDIIIYSDTFEEHIEHLHRVLGMLREHNLKTNVDKCHFCLKQLKLLGKIISHEGVQTDPELIESMINFPVPKTKRQVKQFLALTGYYRQFIKGYIDIAYPLQQLVPIDHKWTWGPDQQEAFYSLKRAMTEAPILALPKWDREFHILTDASLIGAGAVLSQVGDDNKMHPVAYFSKLFNSAQMKYSATEREMLAIVLATRKWKSYLYGRRFTCETDHEALTKTMSLKDPHGKVARWTSELAQFDIVIKYIKGELNVQADTLSRCWDRDMFLPILEEEEIIATFDLRGLPTDKEFAERQKTDPVWGPIVDFIQNEVIPSDKTEARHIISQSKHYVIDTFRDNVLHRRVIRNGIVTLKLCVPQAWRKLILSIYHDSVWAGGHMGRTKTLKKISEKFYFPHLTKYTDLWIKSCPVCQKTKTPSRHVSAPLGSIAASRPNDMLCIDLWGPVTTSVQGNRYILTMIDSFSRQAQVAPIPSKNANVVAKALISKWIAPYGPPIRVHSDRGGEFVNEILKEVCRLFHIKQSLTTAYHPQGNAIAERIHRYFRNALSSFVREDGRNWDEIIVILIMVYNSAYHETLGCTPSEAFLGRRFGVLTGNVEKPKEDYSTLEYVERLKYTLYTIQQDIYEKVYKDRLSRKSKDFNINLKVGDEVAIYSPAKAESSKLFPQYKGPYTIQSISKDKKVLYLLDEFGEELNSPISILRVKKWTSRVEDLTLQDYTPGGERSKDTKSVDHSSLNANAVPLPLSSSLSEEDSTIQVDNQERLDTNYYPPLHIAKEVEGYRQELTTKRSTRGLAQEIIPKRRLIKPSSPPLEQVKIPIRF